MTETTDPDWKWEGINLHELLARFKIHSMTEEDFLLDHASVQNQHNIEVLKSILNVAYSMGLGHVKRPI